MRKDNEKVVTNDDLGFNNTESTKEQQHKETLKENKIEDFDRAWEDDRL